MKHIFYIVTIVLFCLALSSCKARTQNINSGDYIKAQSNAENVFEIKDKFFIARINEIFLNPKNYKDKNIKLEGFYKKYTDQISQQEYHCVLRYGPGCCNNDGEVGFEFVWDGEYPKDNEWIEVIGKIEMVKDGDNQYPRLKLSGLKVKEQRGQETVLN